jgi:DNA-directed RNA polymerase subunit RPC12/RpoP
MKETYLCEDCGAPIELERDSDGLIVVSDCPHCGNVVKED